MAVPKYDDLFNPLIKAVHRLGGSASVSEIEDNVADLLNLSEEDINDIHRGNTTKLSYRLAWTRNYLKRFGVLENSSRGVWSLTAKGKTTPTVDKDEVNKFVKRTDAHTKPEDDQGNLSDHESQTWRDSLLGEIKKLTPPEFEKLCQRILRESGFIQVAVTGRSGDGGIDGRGVVRLGGFLSFHVIFQCKRYEGSVTSQQIREFKGTMVGRADKGLFLTTGTFTRDARQEALRDGSSPIDLVDGEMLVEKMKELGLGVKVSSQEVVEIDTGWFSNF